MLISSITIENFKGINEPVRIDFKPITLLFGPISAIVWGSIEKLGITTKRSQNYQYYGENPQ